MKKPPRGATLALLAISPFAWLACSDDSVSGGGTFTLPDASVLPIADAAPTLDAGSEPDADADAGPATTATVQVATATKLPEQNVKVVFYDATGHALGTETTDATGKATHTIAPGGSITAVFGSASQPSLVSILGVEPGDALTVLDPARIFNVTFAVTAPALPTDATHHVDSPRRLRAWPRRVDAADRVSLGPVLQSAVGRRHRDPRGPER